MKMRHPLLPMPKRSKEIDDQYSTLGRALSYATEFENNSRKLAHLLDVKDTTRDFGFEIYMLMKEGRLFEKVELIKRKHDLPDWAVNKIHEARKSRNFIAHEIAENHVAVMQTKEGRKCFESDILIASQSIAEGNQIVLGIIEAIHDKVKMTHGSDIVEYNFAVMEWILP